MAKTQALAKWDAELAALAQESAEQVAGLGGGQFFSIRAGTLSLGGSPIPNNEMGVVVVDHVLENVHYGSEYDPDQAGSPGCYAFGRKADEMAPHPACPEKVSAACRGCPNNEFGSADKGKGKACKNRIRLALIPAGTMKNGNFVAFDEPEQFATAQVSYLALPPTSIGCFGSYVKQIKGALDKAVLQVFTRVKVVPDPKTQLKVTFELLEEVPNELMPTLLAKNKEVRAGIIFPYPEREAAPKKAKKRKF